MSLPEPATTSYTTPPPEDFAAPRPPGAGALLLFTVIFMMIQTLFMVLVLVLGRIFPFLPPTLLMLAGGVVSTLLWGFAAWFWITVRALPRSWLSLTVPPARGMLWPLLLLMVPVVVVFGSNLDMLVMHAFPVLQQPDSTLQSMTEATLETPLAWLLVIGLAVVAAPICEELFFRGVVLRSLRLRRWAFLPAALFTSALFAAIHLKLAGFFLLFTVAAVLALLAEHFSSLLPAVLFHALYNAFVLAVSLGAAWMKAPELQPFSMKPPAPVTSEIPPVSTSLLLLALSGPVLAVLLVMLRRSRPAPESIS
ncbi:CPBP family intramembrane metalloprotease [Myxococcota bacterium]|nr:CPBP family intramembrane metalloprotease [Myxococcota bacterium]MBU1508988.1 CPBP family intramembrane metalloprotease [Myxococcota bacterium]